MSEVSNKWDVVIANSREASKLFRECDKELLKVIHESQDALISLEKALERS